MGEGAERERCKGVTEKQIRNENINDIKEAGSTEAVLTSTHNLCFLAKIRKLCITPINPSFTILKWGLMGYLFHGHVFMMIMQGNQTNIQLPSHLPPGDIKLMSIPDNYFLYIYQSYDFTHTSSNN